MSSKVVKEFHMKQNVAEQSVSWNNNSYLSSKKVKWHDCCGILSAYQKNTTNNLTNHSRNINPIRLGHTSSSIEYDTQPQLSGVVF